MNGGTESPSMFEDGGQCAFRDNIGPRDGYSRLIDDGSNSMIGGSGIVIDEAASNQSESILTNEKCKKRQTVQGRSGKTRQF